MCEKSCGTGGDLVKGVVPNMKGDPTYKDAPRFPMIYDYEGEFKSNYNMTIKAMSIKLAATMVKFIKES